jgi:hypothetical protein
MLGRRTYKNNEMLNTETIELNMDSLMSTMAENTAKFAPGKREHLMHVMRALLDCYRFDAKQGIALLRDCASESQNMMLVAINADPSQVDEMIDTLCNLHGMSTAVSAGTVIN